LREARGRAASAGGDRGQAFCSSDSSSDL